MHIILYMKRQDVFLQQLTDTTAPTLAWNCAKSKRDKVIILSGCSQAILIYF